MIPKAEECHIPRTGYGWVGRGGSEDLNPNQLYRGMAIVNPFAED